MEYIDGLDFDSYLFINPENVNEIFLQAIEGFAYLESVNILHRDIRPQNLMIGHDNSLKIIDFGFGKKIDDTIDYDKSINLNWWCDPPREIMEGRYDFGTEVYFVGKIFELAIIQNNIESFNYMPVLSKMCVQDLSVRFSSFSRVKQAVLSEGFSEFEFSEEELEHYRSFSAVLTKVVTKFHGNAKFNTDIDEILKRLETIHKNIMLEKFIPRCNDIAPVFIEGAFYYSRNATVYTETLTDFVKLFRRCSGEKRNIILSNIHSKLEPIERYWPRSLGDDDIPF